MLNVFAKKSVYTFSEVGNSPIEYTISLISSEVTNAILSFRATSLDEYYHGEFTGLTMRHILFSDEKL